MKLSDILFKFTNIDKYFSPQEFWCTICDEQLVKTHNPETGVWFQVGGHTRIHKGNRLDYTGDHETIIFAVCTKCYGDFKYE